MKEGSEEGHLEGLRHFSSIYGHFSLVAVSDRVGLFIHAAATKPVPGSQETQINKTWLGRGNSVSRDHLVSKCREDMENSK